MNIVIVEDEKITVNHFVELLRQWELNHTRLTIETYGSGEEAILHYNETKNIDIIFLDIQMKKMNGVQTAQKYRQLGYQNAIAFTTRHQLFELAQEGIALQIIQYLVKPLSYDEVEKCLNRISAEKNFTFVFRSEQYVIPYKNIAYFESRNHYIHIDTVDFPEIPEFKANLSDVGKGLSSIFIQCHRSYIINITHIKKIKSKVVVLSDNQEVAIGKNYYQNLVDRFARY